MHYDVVIATRNRPSMLRLSIPLILAQRRLPRRLIVVDSSEDHASVQRAVAECSAGTAVEIILRKSAAGASLQRNLGMQEVRSDIVFFPDDDILWFPGVAESVMRIYERDEAGDIGAVCCANSAVPPPQCFCAGAQRNELTRRQRLLKRLERPRAIIEERLFPDPFHLYGQSRWGIRPCPPWLNEENVVLVEWSGIGRASYRTEVFRRHQLDETLGRYSLFEDVDASFNIMQTHLFVGANQARVFHYEAPGPRANAIERGAMQLLNRSYIICKHTASGDPARRRLSKFGWYKLTLYSTGVLSRLGRERIAGAWRAMWCTDELLNAPKDQLAQRYLELRKRCMGA